MDPNYMVKGNPQGLREVESPPAFEAGPAPALHVWHPPQESALREYLRVLIKRKWTVLGCLFLIFGLVLIASLKMTPIYEATGRIAINKPDNNLVNFKDSPNGGGDYYTDPTDLDTEVSILQSDLLALQVIKNLNLDKMPEFGGKPSTGPDANLAPDPLQADSTRTGALIAAFKGGLRVSLKPNTRIVEISYSSTSSTLAALIVNTLATTYAEQNFKTKFESTMQASDWLQKQLSDLQIKVETSQEKLVKYQKEHEILGADEKQNIITEKLQELNRELTTAEALRMEKESLYRLVQSADAATVASTAEALEAGGANGSAGMAPLLGSLRTRETDLKVQVADLSTQFGPSYPKVVQLNNQLKEVDAQINNELQKVIERVRGQYLAAQSRKIFFEANSRSRSRKRIS